MFVCSINPLGIRGSSSRQLSISVTRSRRLRAFLDHFCAYVKSTGVGVREVPNETVGGLAEIFFFLLVSATLVLWPVSRNLNRLFSGMDSLLVSIGGH